MQVAGCRTLRPTCELCDLCELRTANCDLRNMLDEKRTIKFPALILVSLMAVKIAAQYFLIHPSFDLQRDEYLHLDLANHPAWGYMSVPPVTSWIAMVIKLLGNDVFWVKFFPALFGAFTMFFCWKIVEELGGI